MTWGNVFGQCFWTVLCGKSASKVVLETFVRAYCMNHRVNRVDLLCLIIKKVYSRTGVLAICLTVIQFAVVSGLCKSFFDG